MSLSERSGLSSTTTKAFIFFQSHVLGRAPAGCVQAAARPGLAPCQPPAFPAGAAPAAGQAAGEQWESARDGSEITPQTCNQTLRGEGTLGEGISIPLTQLRQHGAEAGVTHAWLNQ